MRHKSEGSDSEVVGHFLYNTIAKWFIENKEFRVSCKSGY